MKTYAGFRRRWEPPHEGDVHPAIEEFVATKLARYAQDRDFPSRDGTSKLSPLLASGEVAIADCAAAALEAPPGEGRQKWLDELAWHEWFEHVKSAGLDAPRIEPRWDPPSERFDRWRSGLDCRLRSRVQAVDRRLGWNLRSRRVGWRRWRGRWQDC